jgi:hypothetical protein
MTELHARLDDAPFIVVDDRQSPSPQPAAAASGQAPPTTAAVARSASVVTDEEEFYDNSAVVHWTIIAALAVYTAFSLWVGRGNAGWALMFTCAAVTLQLVSRRNTYLRVTADGIQFPNRFPSEVRWEQIAAARQSGNGVELTLDNAERVRISFLELGRRDIGKLRKVLQEQLWREV